MRRASHEDPSTDWVLINFILIRPCRPLDTQFYLGVKNGHYSALIRASACSPVRVSEGPLGSFLYLGQPLCQSHVFGTISLPKSCIWDNLFAKVMYLGQSLCQSHVFGTISLPKSCIWDNLFAKVLYLGQSLPMSCIGANCFATL
jgi:hypothetical protein